MSDTPQNIKVETDPTRWLQEYGDVLFGYALKRLHNSAQAEDVVQETLLAALKASTSFSGRSSEKTWLVGILKHKIIDLIRKQVRELTVDDINALSDSSAKQGIDELFDGRGHWIKPPQDWGNPEKMLHNQQFMEFFRRCMERLKPIHAQIFSLKELSGQTIEEICNELDVTATNCSVMLYRARMGLRRCLEVHLVDDHPGEL